jgi:cytochrome c1
MKKLLSTLALIGATAVALLAAPAVRAEGNFPLDRAPDNTENLVSLQHGAKLFVNYCLNCHGANLMRYNRLTDLGISQKEIKEPAVHDRQGRRNDDRRDAARRREELVRRHAARPVCRGAARGRDWLYTYLRSFYRDDTRPTGWNNAVFENVGMPHVLWELQGSALPNSKTRRTRRRARRSIRSSASSKSHRGHCRRRIMTLRWPTWWLYDVDGRAGSADPQTPRRVGADLSRRPDFPGLAAQCRVLERYQKHA